MSNILTAEEQMAVAIAKAKEARKKAKDEAKLKLLENEKYVDYLAMVEEESEEVSKLTTIMETANKMKAIVATDGTKYSVNCYPVAEYLFGPVVSRVIGLINASPAMFTDDRAEEFSAMTGVSTLVLNNAKHALGSVAYFSKGKYVNEVPGDEELLNSAVLAVLQGLDLDIAYIDKFSTKNIENWFTRADIKAKQQLTEFTKTDKLDSTTSFILED